jgi:glycerophosphoryl diester phosphodiesterase
MSHCRASHTALRWFPSALFLLIAAPASAQVIVAHRGASYDAPENTIAAFEEAWKQSADGIEGDFYITRDQQIVCIHDSNTERTAGKKLEVARSTLMELRALEYGGWKAPKFKGESIPTFAEVMAVIPDGKLFVIELKTGPEIVPLLKAELDRLQPEGRNLLIIAFNKETVAAVKHHLPTIRVHWLTGFKKNKSTGDWHPTVEEVATTLKTTGADGLGVQGNREIVTAAWADSLKKSGLKEFHVWTIDDPADAEFFRSLGVIGITTNRPALIREALTKP